MQPIVEMCGVTKTFPGVLANERVDFDVLPGEIHALLGENGAGKTTLMNVLYGLYQPDEGEIRVGGAPTVIRSPSHAIAAGIGMVHQHFKLVPTLTVTETIVLGKEVTRGPFLRPADAIRTVEKLSQDFGIEVSPTKKIYDLSVGERQRVEILKVLYRGAKILILDEPTAVLTPPEVEPLFKTLRTMVRQGKSIVFISHKLNEVMAITNRVTVLRRGKLVDTVETAGATERSLAQLMVGRDVVLPTAAQSVEENVRPVCVAIRGLTVAGAHAKAAVQDVSFEIREGEIVGIAGVDGNGQSELAEAIAGVRLIESGSITVDAMEMVGAGVEKRTEAGVWYVPADRHSRGCAPELSIAMNAVLKHYRREPFSKRGILSVQAIRNFAESIVEAYDVRCASVDVRVGTLSGGNMQKLIIGRETVSEPRFLIAEQPARGLDVSAIEFVRNLLVAQRDRGAAVLLISADLDEIMALSDRILVMYEGRIAYQCTRRTVDIDQIGLAMAGMLRDQAGVGASTGNTE